MRVLFFASVLTATTALASADYPGFIQTKYSLALPVPQSCSLCHTNGVTGTGTVNTLLGTALRGKGMTSGNTNSVGAALDALEAASSDVDGDGVTDVDELKAGTNPNVAESATGGGAGGGGGTTVAALKYGCGSSVAPELVFVLAVAPFVRRKLLARR
ncbi:MAG: thrombospondin type 3 repeat-containing protein [Myxococcaceae bacterium]